MFIVWGSGYYGDVDHVPRLCHVATHFGHLYYIPLIPTGSFILTHQDGDTDQGVSLPIQWKSVGMAYLRTLCVLAVILLATLTFFAFMERRYVAGAVLITAGVLVGWFLERLKRSAFFTQASYERAVELGKRLGLTRQGELMIEVAYGRLTPAQADAELAKYDEEIIEATAVEPMGHIGE